LGQAREESHTAAMSETAQEFRVEAVLSTSHLERHPSAPPKFSHHQRPCKKRLFPLPPHSPPQAHALQHPTSAQPPANAAFSGTAKPLELTSNQNTGMSRISIKLQAGETQAHKKL